jgi:hypothetical protein
MKKFLQSFWRVITFPFRLIYKIIAWPFRMIGRGMTFLNTDVEDRPILDTFSNLATEEEARASFRQRRVLTLESHIVKVPEDARARVLLASSYAEMGRAEESVREMEFARALRPIRKGSQRPPPIRRRNQTRFPWDRLQA